MYNKCTKTVIGSINIIVFESKDITIRGDDDDSRQSTMKQSQTSETSYYTRCDNTKKESPTIPTEITTASSSVNMSCISTEASPTVSNINSIETESTKEQSFMASACIKKNHLTSSVIGDTSNGIATRKKNGPDYAKTIANVYFTSTVEPTNVIESLKDEQWIKAMQDRTTLV